MPKTYHYPDNVDRLNDLIEKVNRQLFRIRQLAESQTDETAQVLEDLAWSVEQACEHHGDIAFNRMYADGEGQ